MDTSLVVSIVRGMVVGRGETTQLSRVGGPDRVSAQAPPTGGYVLAPL